MLAIDRDALTVAMALVPGMYARNKMFALHREPEVRHAKARAAMIRGVVRQLAGERGEVEGVAMVRHGEVTVLRFRVPQVSFERRLELTDIERACLVFLASRAGVRGLHMTPRGAGAHRRRAPPARRRRGHPGSARPAALRPSEWPPR